jgi:hypothetical protein
VAEWYPPGEFVASLLHGADPALIKEYSEEIRELLAIPHLFEMDEKTMEICERWDDFCARLFHAYQEQALAEAEAAPVKEDKAGETVSI